MRKRKRQKTNRKSNRKLNYDKYTRALLPLSTVEHTQKCRWFSNGIAHTTHNTHTLTYTCSTSWKISREKKKKPGTVYKQWWTNDGVQSKETILCALCNRTFLYPMIDVVIYCQLNMTRTRRMTLSTLSTFAIIINLDFLQIHNHTYLLILSFRSGEHQNALQNAKSKRIHSFSSFPCLIKLDANSGFDNILFGNGEGVRSHAKRSMPIRWDYFNS